MIGKKKYLLIGAGILAVALALFFGIQQVFFDGNKDTVVGTLPYEFTPSTLAKPMDGKLLLYDGKALQLVNADGKINAQVEINGANYALEVGETEIFLADGSKRMIYILDKKCRVLNQVEMNYLPKQVVATANKGFLVHYFTDVYLEGVRLYSQNAMEVKDLQFPGLTITSILPAMDGGFIVCGINKGEDKLVSTIYYYDERGEYLSAVKLESMIIMEGKVFKDKVVLLDPDYLILMDNERNIAKKFYSVAGYQQMVAKENSVTYLDKKNTVRTMDYDGKSLFQKSWDLSLVGFFFNRDRVYVYDRDTIYGEKEENYVKEELLKVVPLGRAAALITQDQIEFIKEIR